MTKSDLQSQCNPHQNSNDIFTEIEKNPKIHFEGKKSQNSQRNTVQKE
jgi:hypothetical protein